MEESALNEQLYNFSFVDVDFNLLAYEIKNVNIGFNAFLEEDLPDNDLNFTDFFMYNFGVNFNINQFQASLFIENFLDLNNTELNIEPAFIENNSSLVYLEHDTPSLIHLSLVYIF